MPQTLHADPAATRFASRFLVAALALGVGAACSNPDKGSGGGPGAGGAGATPSGNAGGQSAGGAQGGSPVTPGGAAGATSGGAAAGGMTPNAGGLGGAGASATGGGGTSPAGGNAGTSVGGGTFMGTGGHVTTDGGLCCTTRDCQPMAVQTCVCDTWQQGQCCTGVWDTFCQTTAEQKCQATHCQPSPTGDAGIDPTKGACCATHSTPGCADTSVETCVCKLLPDCCDKQWDSVCVQLVREKHCEPGIRDCVCTTWQQSSCCDTQWTDTCKIVAEDKCMSQPSCP